MNFSKRVKDNRIKLVSLLNKLIKQRKKIIAVSAPAKGMTLLNYCKIDKHKEKSVNDNIIKINKNNFNKLIKKNKTVAKYYLDLDNNNNYYKSYETSKNNNKKFSGCYEINMKLFILYFIQKNIKYLKKLQKNTKYFNNDSISLIDIYN